MYGRDVLAMPDARPRPKSRVWSSQRGEPRLQPRLQLIEHEVGLLVELGALVRVEVGDGGADLVGVGVGVRVGVGVVVGVGLELGLGARGRVGLGPGPGSGSGQGGWRRRC